MKKDNKKVGALGEKIADQYLRDKGYRIEERNFTTRSGEIDIVCWDGKTLVFVEVKAKNGHDFGEPEEMVNKNKLNRVKRMGEEYLLKNNLDCLCRIDVVGIVLDSEGLVERLSHHCAVY